MDKFLQRLTNNCHNNKKVCVFPRSQFEANKKCLLSEQCVITYFNYKRGDQTFTALCLKENQNEN